MASQDCLLNCLHEVKLDRFHKNFVERGLLNCEQLSSLTLEDYARYGVVSTDDRHRLSQLIHIIKSVQADGMFCQHGGILPPAPKKTVSKPMISGNVVQNGNNMQPSLGHRGQVPVSRARSGEEVVREKCPPAPSKSFIKPFNGDVNYRVQYERPSKPRTVEEIKVNLAGVSSERGDNSPIFECRKTLKFSDSDMYSDDESDCLSALTNGNLNSYQNVKSTESSLPVAYAPSSTSSVYMNIQVSQQQTIREPTIAVQSSRNGPGTESKLTVKTPLSNGAVTQPKMDRKSDRRASQVQSDVNSSVISSKTFMNSTSKGVHHPIKRLSNGGSEDLRHAYFPISSNQTSHEDLPIQVGKVYSTTGYNYGVPKSGVLHAAQQRTADLQIDGDTRGYNEKIRVCVRKRPRTVREAKRNEVDVVKVRGRQTVIVEELKVAVDLTKYMQQHVMTFDVAFDETCQNKDVYERAVKPLVAAVFEKCSAVCFAFGQTGAGKTYTLLGNKSEPGLYQLAGEDLFALSRSAAKQLGSLHVWVSYYEIYCGHLFDLLNKRKRLHVRENGRHKVCITGLMENEVCDLKSLIRVVSYGNTFRSHGSTGVNPHSSRSHALLQLEVRNDSDAKIGRMTFIDLAGSERAADAINSDRQTRMEGAEINQSLLALKECIRSIDQEACHTPYRQSKLTHILRESFLGQSLTVMIANVAPTQAACEDTLNTLRYADRVKELTKEAAKKANRSGNGCNITSVGNVTSGTGCNITSVGNVTQTISQAPISGHNDDSPSPTKSPMIKQHAMPSVFHPSNIQFTSTPLKTGNLSKPNPSRDSPCSILDGAGEIPITGHTIYKRSSAEELHLDRISPIDDSSKHNVEIRFRKNSSSPDIVGTGKFKSQNIATSSHGMVDHCSPCSCRSFDDLSISARVSMRMTDRPGTSVHRHHAVLDKNEPRALFGEVKACMENARANIRNFLRGEKDKDASPVVSTEHSDALPALVEPKPSWIVDHFTSEDVSRNVLLGSESSVRKADFDGGGSKTLFTSSTSSTVQAPVNEDTVRQTAGAFSDTNSQLQQNSRPTNNIVTESGSSVMYVENLETDAGQNKEAGFKSWAEIFEQSADSLRSGNGIGIDHVMPGDTQPADDFDLVTPEMLETLKVKIADLKLRQERLERDQLLAHGVQSTLMESHQVFNAVTSQNLKSEEKLADADANGSSTIAKSNTQPLQSVAGTSVPIISSGAQLNKQNTNVCSDHGDGLPSLNNFTDNSVTPNIVHCTTGLPNISSTTGSVTSNSKLARADCSENKPEVSVAEPKFKESGGMISDSGCYSGAPSTVISLPSHVQSAFRVVERKKEPCGSVESNQSETSAVVNASHPIAGRTPNSESAAPAQTVVWPQTSFMPIEPQPVTIPSSISLAASDWRQADGKAIELSGSSVDSLNNDVLMTTEAKNTAQNLQFAENERLRSENLLVMSHEDQLTAIIHLCKQEMSLLIDVRSGSMNFDAYLLNVQKILSTKQKIISALNLHISEFR